MIGIVGFEHHKIYCIIGCHPDERQHEQDIYLDLKVGVDFTHCAETDDIKDAFNYVVLAQICTELARRRKYHLQETFAKELLVLLLNESNILWGWVKIKKPAAIPSAQYATIELRMEKKQMSTVYRGGDT